MNSGKKRPYKPSVSIGLVHCDPHHPCTLAELIKAAKDAKKKAVVA